MGGSAALVLDGRRPCCGIPPYFVKDICRPGVFSWGIFRGNAQDSVLGVSLDLPFLSLRQTSTGLPGKTFPPANLPARHSYSEQLCFSEMITHKLFALICMSCLLHFEMVLLFPEQRTYWGRSKGRSMTYLNVGIGNRLKLNVFLKLGMHEGEGPGEPLCRACIALARVLFQPGGLGGT